MIQNFKPRLWQELTLKQLSATNYSALVQAPTAAGKTVFAIMSIRILKVKDPTLKTAIVVPTIHLLKQWKRELIKFLGISEKDIGEYYGQKKDGSLDKKFMIYVINSAARDNSLVDQQQINPFDYIIFDEVHHVGANSYSKLLEISSYKYKLGISATPDREYDTEGMEKILSFFGSRINVSKNNVELSPLTLNMIRVNFTEEEKQKYRDLKEKLRKLLGMLESIYGISRGNKDFFKKITSLAESGIIEAKAYIGIIRRMEGMRFTARNKLNVIRHLANKELNKKTIIFCDRISFVEEIYSLLSKQYPEREIFLIHSGLKKSIQKKNLDQFSKGEKSILIAARIVDEGFDVPDASQGVLISFTKSKRQSIQRDGRILRFMKGKIAKKYVIVIRDIDEEDYLGILEKIDQLDSALKGAWLDFEDDNFRISEEFKTQFNLNHLKRKIIANK
jgi:superfamily II DNA or RNA helicase